ncbi:mCG142666 [Mus musculus]|nr:mCG142666 [Mus musculus]
MRGLLFHLLLQITGPLHRQEKSTGFPTRQEEEVNPKGSHATVIPEMGPIPVGDQP